MMREKERNIMPEYIAKSGTRAVWGPEAAMTADEEAAFFKRQGVKVMTRPRRRRPVADKDTKEGCRQQEE